MDEIKQRLESINKRLRDAQAVPSEDWNLEKHTSEARKQLANKFVNCFFVILTLSFVVPLVYNIAMYTFTGNDSLFLPLKDVVLLTSSILGGPLGFIVGFYFKDK